MMSLHPENSADLFCIDRRYSTNRLVTRTKPDIENHNEDKFATRLFYPESIDKDRTDAGGLRKKGYFKKDLRSLPLVTVITVVYNGEKFIENTIHSVLHQTYDNMEYIVIDGGSADKTVDIIKNYDSQIDYWISEKDSGAFDAMNKGITLSTGKIVGIINSDDYYDGNAVQAVVDQYRALPAEGIIYGNIIRFDAKNKMEIKSDLRPQSFADNKIVFNHPACFVCRPIYKRFGLFDVQYEMGADVEFMLRAHFSGAKFHHIDQVLAYFRWGGTTTRFSLDSANKRIVQRHNYLKRYYPRGICVSDLLLNTLRLYRNFFLSIFLSSEKIFEYIHRWKQAENRVTDPPESQK